MPTEPITTISVARIVAWIAKVPASKIWNVLKWLDRKKVSGAVIALAVLVIGAIVGGIVLFSPTSSLTRLPDDVDLGAYCGAPASGNLAQAQCQWQIPDYNAVCQWQYSQDQYPSLSRPLHMTFSVQDNPSSGQCYDRNDQLVGQGGRSGVDMAGYCNYKLTNRPAGVSYDSVPVPNSDSWLCVRNLDILAVCVTTFQESDLVARLENGKVICYRRG